MSKTQSDSPLQVEPISTLPEFLQQLIRTGKYTDVELIVGPDDVKKSFNAHKMVLAARSDVFDAMFYGPLKETSDVIHLPDCDPDAFKYVLNFVYTDAMGSLPTHLILPVLYIARKYLLPKLQQPEYILERALNKINVCNILNQGLASDEKEVVRYCLFYFCMHAGDILKLDEFTLSSKAAIDLIVKQSILNVEKEVEVFEALCRWANLQCEMGGVPNTPDNVRQYLGDALYHVRFTKMTQEELVKIVRPSGLLATETRGRKLYKVTFSYVGGSSNDYYFYFKLKVKSFMVLSNVQFSYDSFYGSIPMGRTAILYEGNREMTLGVSASKDICHGYDLIRSPILRPGVTYYLCLFPTFTHKAGTSKLVWEAPPADERVEELQVYVDVNNSGTYDSFGCLRLFCCDIED